MESGSVRVQVNENQDEMSIRARRAEGCQWWRTVAAPMAAVRSESFESWSRDFSATMWRGEPSSRSGLSGCLGRRISARGRRFSTMLSFVWLELLDFREKLVRVQAESEQGCL